MIISPKFEITLYVDGKNGLDSNDGLTEETALKTLKGTKEHLQSGTQILVKDGTYRNEDYGSGNKDNPIVLHIQNYTDILLTNFPGHSPIIEFDGAGGISMTEMSRVEISGFEIVGPNRDITKEEAMEDRLLHSNYFSGRGIKFTDSNHIKIHNIIAHHCPSSGIRADRSDYVAFEDNIVFNNTWWSSSASSALVIGDARHIDDLDLTKMFLNRNEVYGNQNFIPFYSLCRDKPDDPSCTEEDDLRTPADYGTENQTYIIDGSGVYVTRNENYKYGRFEMSYNRAYNNGINGLVVHKTDRARVVGNVIWDNGQVPKSEPESRQKYAGLTLNMAHDVEVRDNYVKTELNNDYSYAMQGASLNDATANNKNCKVDNESGTGYGMVADAYGDAVTNGSWDECTDAINGA